MPVCMAQFLREVISDHYPIKANMEIERVKVKKPFIFCNMWSQDPQFEAIVADGWNTIIEGCKMYEVVRKLKLLKKKLKTLRNQYGHSVVAEAEEDRKVLKHAQIQLQSNPTSTTHQQLEAQAYANFRHTSYMAKFTYIKEVKLHG